MTGEPRDMEMVVLLDESGSAIGTHPKSEVHSTTTPLHLAFSSYIVSTSGAVLLTQRALDKLTWPGVWTNSCCGHPAPGESLDRAVLRRVGQELGVHAAQADLVLPGFRYRAVMTNGVVENEMCPVYRIVVDDEVVIDAHPAEVAQTRWVEWAPFTQAVLGDGLDVSPWCAEQVAELSGLGENPLQWPVSAPTRLPPAARIDA